VPEADNFDMRPGGGLRLVAVNGWSQVPRLPLRSRALFILGAAAASWALPALLVYWLIR